MIILNFTRNGRNQIIKFLLTVFVFFIVWFVFHDLYLLKRTKVVYDFTIFETWLSGFLLELLPLSDSFVSVDNAILKNGKRLLIVGEECSGLVLFAVFSGFVIAYPAYSKSKIWFVPLGIFIIFICNIFRIVILTLNKSYFNSIFAFNHHVTFTYLIYGLIFALWAIWIRMQRYIEGNGQKIELKQ